MSSRAFVRWTASILAIAVCAYFLARDDSHASTPFGPRGRAVDRSAEITSEIAATSRDDQRREPISATPPEQAHASATKKDPVRSALAITVLREGELAAGVPVACHLDREEWSAFLFGGSPALATPSSNTDRTGVARFAGLERGVYGIEVGAIPSGACRLFARISDGGAETRLTVALGSAQIEGRVHGNNGEPMHETTILARQAARAGESEVWFHARTNERGDYRIRGLAAGADHAVTAMVSEIPFHGTAVLVLAPGESRRVDFGSPSGRAHWSGVVRLPSGAPVEGFQRLCLVAQGGDVHHDAPFGPGGGFRASLPCGTYEARIASRAGPLLEVVDVRGDTDQDLTMPAATLHGRITYTGTKHPMAHGPEREVVIVLERSSGEIVRAPLVRGDASFGFCALEPGDYQISTRPWVLENSTDGRIAFRIDTVQREIEIDLSITDAAQ